jgi:hypothetical protein
LFFLARLAPDADTGLLNEAAEAFAQAATSEDEETLGWQHELVIDNQWLALNAVPPQVSLDDVPEDLLASDRTYQWVRSGFLENGTTIFINLETLERAILGELVTSDEMAAVKPFRALGVSSTSEPQGDSHAHMTVLIVGE